MMGQSESKTLGKHTTRWTPNRSAQHEAQRALEDYVRAHTTCDVRNLYELAFKFVDAVDKVADEPTP